jgi:hypothetical protein
VEPIRPNSPTWIGLKCSRLTLSGTTNQDSSGPTARADGTPGTDTAHPAYRRPSLSDLYQ